MNFRNARFFFLVIFLTSCGGPQGCFPRFAELKTSYPKVIYHGPKEASEVTLQKSPPPNWRTLSQISRKAQGAVLVSEDWAFYQHHGYDQKQMKEAIQESLEEGKLKRGASTITQQVVKNVYLTKDKNLLRKVRELWMASKIEKVVGKNKILEIYFNIAEWGEGIFGIQSAAQFYFNKSASELNAKEGAFLAMLLPSPKKYAISYRKHQLTPYARKIMKSVLRKMVQAKYLTPEERMTEWSQPLSFEPKSTENDRDDSDEGPEDETSEEAVEEADEEAGEEGSASAPKDLHENSVKSSGEGEESLPTDQFFVTL